MVFSGAEVSKILANSGILPHSVSKENPDIPPANSFTLIISWTTLKTLKSMLFLGKRKQFVRYSTSYCTKRTSKCFFIIISLLLLH